MPYKRRLYIAYLQRARRGRATQNKIKCQGESEWARVFSNADRAAIEAALEGCDDAIALRDQARQVAHDRRERYNAIRADEDPTWPAVIYAASSAATAFELVVPLAHDVHGSAVRLRLALINAHAHARAQARATIDRDLAMAALNQILADLAAMERLRDYPDVPPRVDQVRKIRENWLDVGGCNRRQIHRDARARAFMRGTLEHGDFPGRWIGAWSIGQGGMSNTGLWVRLSDEDIVEDRVVKKTTYIQREDWGDATSWDGDVRSPNREPYEITCHRAMQAIGGLVNVPRLRTTHVSKVEMQYSMYMGYCPHGTLDDLITSIRESPPLQNAAGQDLPTHIPEPMLWYIFLTLAEAGWAMQTGSTDLRAPLSTMDGWREIVHRDLKPANVFLAEPTIGHFDDYPTPTLGDFGIAFRTWPDDPFNPRMFQDGGATDGYRSPEHTSYVDGNTLQPVEAFKLLAHSNVWGMGMIMYSLISFDRRPDQFEWLGDDQSAHDVKGSRRHDYSGDLMDLVQRCIDFLPANRPGFDEIIDTILQLIGEGPGWNLARRMMFPNTADVGSRLRDRIAILPADRYRIGLARAALPPM